VERVKELLEKGADPNTQDEKGRTPLYWAASEGHVDVVRLLLERGVDPNTQDEFGDTPLHEAAYKGRVDVVELLLVRGADPNVKDGDGKTPLDSTHSSSAAKSWQKTSTEFSSRDSRRLHYHVPMRYGITTWKEKESKCQI